MFASALLSAWIALAATAQPPGIDLAFVERRGARVADLELREADPRLMAQCFDPEGHSPEELDEARKALIGQVIWLHQGPRRIARGRVESLAIRADPLIPCAVVARARFERPLPLIGRGDVLWATTKSLDTSPREPVGQDVVERARQALPTDLAEACLERQAVTRRGVRGGTFVGFVCDREGATLSAIAFVPRSGEARVSLVERGDYGKLSLIEILNPGQADRHRLVLSREWPPIGSQRRLELWEEDGNAATSAAAESLASDMLFLLAEEARGSAFESFDDGLDDGFELFDEAGASPASETPDARE